MIPSTFRPFPSSWVSFCSSTEHYCPRFPLISHRGASHICTYFILRSFPSIPSPVPAGCSLSRMTGDGREAFLALILDRSSRLLYRGQKYLGPSGCLVDLAHYGPLILASRLNLTLNSYTFAFYQSLGSSHWWGPREGA